MKRFTRTLSALGLSLTLSLMPVLAQAQTKIKMVLNWKYQGPRPGSSWPRTRAISKPRGWM